MTRLYILALAQQYIQSTDSFSFAPKKDKKVAMSDLATETFDPTLAVETLNLTYKFPGTEKIGLQHVNLEIEWGTFNLLIGPNGAGKSTLLKLLAGKSLIKSGNLKLGGLDPFEDSKTRFSKYNSDINQYITYLGTEWASNQIVRRDINVRAMISSVGGDTFKERRNELIDILDIDPHWSMLSLSDGERRRVQIAMGLIKPWRLLLLDEVTIDLDVVIRQKLMSYLKLECVNRRCCVMYATHIFDGLAKHWYDRLIHISDGYIQDDIQSKDLIFDKELQEPVKVDGDEIRLAYSESIHPIASFWLRNDLEKRGSREDEKAKMAERVAMWDEHKGEETTIESYFKSTRSSVNKR